MRMVLTPREAADEMKISVNKVNEMLAEGKIKAFKVGNCWKIPSDLLKKTIEQWATDEAEERRKK